MFRDTVNKHACGHDRTHVDTGYRNVGLSSRVMHPPPPCAASAVTVTYDFDLKGVATLMRNASAIAPLGPFVIVDNGPPGSLPSGLEERIAPDNSAGVTVVPYQGNRGFGAGCNAGVAAAQATPVHQSARHLQSGHQNIAPQVDQLGTRQLLTQKCHTRFIELMCLIENNDPGGRQQL